MQRCVQGAWFGELPQSHVLGLCSPIVDGQGRSVGLAAAHLPQSWLAAIAQRVRDGLDVDRRARALVVDDRQRVLVDTRGSPAPSLPGAASVPSEAGAANPSWTPGPVAVQRLDDDRRHVVVRARDDDNPTLRRLGLQVLLIQPAEEPFWRGGVNQRQIAWMSLGLSVLAALVGIVFARRLTRRLTDLTVAVKSVGTNPEARIEAPAGKDEVSELGHAFSALLDTLRREHDALTTLTSELEERVAARTREVELLAADSRYAAVVRERLRLARDLHDTLAHSMMAMLAEVRLLRRLHTHDPSSLEAELERAEQVAHDGLNEARNAIGQIRLNVVRDLGLGPALSSAISRFGDRTGLDVAYKSDPHAWTFADERAEVMFRIAEEALRNIDRHARASHVDVTLKDHDNATIELTIRDDGVGFDAESPHPGHYGLIGMREQAQLIDAELAVTSVAQQGSTLRLRLHVGPGLPS
jgi:signal transduction histidine kinase